LTSARVQSRRTMRFLVVTILAINFSIVCAGSDMTGLARECMLGFE
jgi:hypothetical protein